MMELLLTANARQARFLRQQYQQQQKQRLSIAPHIFALDEWLSHCYEIIVDRGLPDTPYLLSTNQCQSLWQRMVKNSLAELPLIDARQCAELARQAYRYVKQWDLTSNSLPKQLNTEQQHFKKWYYHYECLCQENTWLDPDSLLPFLLSKFQQQILPLANNIKLFGFSQQTPQQINFFKQLEQLGCCVMPITEPPGSSAIERYVYPNFEIELNAVAAWAKQQYQQDKSKRIACIFPSLQHDWQQIARIFAEHFVSEPNAYNLSAGHPLTQEPLIHTALLLLQLQTNNINIEDFNLLLRSPFIHGAETELSQCQRLAFKLNELGLSSFDYSQLVSVIESYTPMLKQTLDNVFQLNDTGSRGRCHGMTAQGTTDMKPTAWIEQIHELLSAWGWPGERALDSREYQVWSRFTALVNTLSEWEIFNRPYGLQEIINIIKQLADNTVFQVQSSDAPIQLLGTLEAAGLKFDAMHLVGFNDQNWPGAADPNPFLPLAFQQQHAMPHASAERELIFCQSISQDYFNASAQLRVSHSEQLDGQEVQVSPLFAAITINQTPTLDKPLSASLITEAILEEQVAFSAESPKGGASLLKSHGDCPFQALARYRLSNKRPAATTFGITPIQRGNIVHEGLEYIWQQLNEQKQLIALSEVEITELIKKSLKQSATLNAIYRFQPQARALVNLENNYLSQLIKHWLEYEKSRPYFKIRAVEQVMEYQLAGLKLKLRIDRIDELTNNDLMLIDYKTGAHTVSDWLTEPPRAPQLPAYLSALATQPVAAIAFAGLNPSKLGCSGLTNSKLLDEFKYMDDDDWLMQKKQWQNQLQNLAADFATGQNQLQPRTGKATCQQCQAQALCRVNLPTIHVDKFVEKEVDEAKNP